MMKWTGSILMGFALAVTVTALGFASGDVGSAVRDNETKGAKLRLAFVQEIKGEKTVFIRLTPDQAARGKLKARAAGKRGYTRLALRPRQVTALNNALKNEGLEKRLSKLVIRVPSKTVGKHGLKSIYIVRPLSSFVTGGDGEIEEEAPVTYP